MHEMVQKSISPHWEKCHLVSLQLKEVVEIVGVEGRAQVRRCGSLAEAEIRVGRVGFGSERVKGAGLVGVLQGEVDPVEKLRGLVHGGTRVYGRQQAHLSTRADSPPRTRLGNRLAFRSPPVPRRMDFSSCRRAAPCPPRAGSSSSARPSWQLLKSHCAYMSVYQKVFPLLPMVRYLSLTQRGRGCLNMGMTRALRHWGEQPISARGSWTGKKME